MTEVGDIRVAIEGPCCAGKTTLADGITALYGGAAVATVPDYADFLGGGGRGMPDESDASVDGQRRALSTLLAVEEHRFSAAAPLIASCRLLLIDRSCLTLVAHCAGLDASGEQTHELERLAAERVLTDHRAVLPSHVVYLDVTNDVQRKRNLDKFSATSIFMQPTFNRGFRDYFAREASTDFPIDLLWVDGGGEPGAVVDEVVAFLEDRDLAPGTARNRCGGP